MRNVSLRPALVGCVLIVVFLLAGLSSAVIAQQPERTPVPLVTLVPPTPLPPAPTATPQPMITQSALARIKANGYITVGIPYNIARFATLTTTGDIDGFEADIAQAIADDWGVKLHWQQVTRRNGVDLLLNGQIDLLVGQVIVSRDTQAQIDFSDPVFANRQVALAPADSTMQDIKDLNGQTVGLVMGSRAEEAFNVWAEANSIQAEVKRYTMLDEALRALSKGEINALAGDRWELHERVAGVIQGVKLLSGAFRVEPYGIAMRRYDDNLRILVNRTLQRLVQSQRYTPIYDVWFPKNLMPEEDRVIPRVWLNIDADTRSYADFPTDILMPPQSGVARIKAKQAIRVAGLGAPVDASGKPTVFETFNQALVNEMGRRWGVAIEAVPDSYGKGEDVLASGQADLALGVEPHWGSVDRVDFVGVYADHGYRLLVRAQSGIEDFSALFTGVRSVGVFADDQAAFDTAKKLMTKAGIAEGSIRKVNINSEQEAVERVFENQTARVLFADELRLIPIAQANPSKVQLAKKRYDLKPISFAVQRNDPDFRVLVDVTLQEMYRDGTYQRLWKDTFGLGDPLSMTVWPGSSTVFGIKTSG